MSSPLSLDMADTHMNPASLLTLPTEGYAFNDFILSPPHEIINEYEQNNNRCFTYPLNSKAQSCENQN